MHISSLRLTAVPFMIAALLLSACTVKKPSQDTSIISQDTSIISQDTAAQTQIAPITYSEIGSIEVYDSALSSSLLPTAKVESLADGFSWSEGPAWDSQRQQLYFSDVPQNKAYSWSQRDGVKTLLDPSGIAPSLTAGFLEAGSNGLLMHPNGQLIIANHGKRALEFLDIDTLERTALIGEYMKRPFNSPNDIALAKDGSLFFTDPPYGLEGMNESPLKEQSFNSVYHLSKSGELSVIDDTLSFPNGIALSPDEQHLYVAVSDPKNPVIMRYKKTDQGQYENGHIWFDARADLEQGLAGLPDGMAVADNGRVFASGPGGIFIVSPDGKALGKIRFKDAVANCTFGDDGNSLYITAGAHLVRVRLVSGKAL